MTGIVVVGSINADLNLRVERHPGPGETLIGADGSVTPGGKGANQAVAARRLGAEVRMVGAVGDDAHAGAALSLLEECGVGVDTVSTSPGTPTGLAVVTVDEHGENTIVVVPGANTTVDSAAVGAHAALLEDADIVVLQGEIPRSGIEAAARLCGGRVILNPAPVLELDAEVLHRADPLVVNEHEAGLVLGLLAPGKDVPEDAGNMLQALRRAGIGSLVLTLGGEGALVLPAGATEVVPVPASPVAAVDTTGAGDAFIGALAAHLLKCDDLVEAALFAARVGAFAVRSEGAQPSYPYMTDDLPGPVEASR